jgi:BirA family biotin operon repressor/biotin-[acetyl-CoA-carboxylase] ligase
MSLILRPLTPSQPQLLSLVGALSVVHGIESATGLKSSVRWPNDVLVRGRKVSGVLAEASYSGKALSYVVLGIGLNCNSNATILERAQGMATSLLEELGRPVDMTELRGRILDEFQLVYARWLDGEDIAREAESVVGTIGKRVFARTKSGTEFSCTALELESGGGLVVLNEGEEVVLRAEDLEWLREES